MKFSTMKNRQRNFMFSLYLFLNIFTGFRTQDAKYWIENAERELKSVLNFQPNIRRAKNVILFIGDGMGIQTLTAARILKGQLKGELGEDEKLSFESFPNVALIKTYSTDYQVPDSAATATAIVSGIKTKFFTLGVDAQVKNQNCSSSLNASVPSVADWVLDAGKSVGVITDMRVTHATPAALYAHSASRTWENNADIPKNSRFYCKDIARQLIEDFPGKDFKVILGGGRRNFISTQEIDPEYSNKTGLRTDGINLIKKWIEDKQRRNVHHKYVWNKKEFNEVDPKTVDYLLGMFEPSHMLDYFEEKADPLGEPSLKDMTRKAMQILKKNPNGYFLMVEGGMIDTKHHENRAVPAIHSAVLLDEAVQEALDSASPSDTLIIITSDHSHGMSISGYPTRGNPIFGIVEISDEDKLPYTTLSYATGPGFGQNRENISKTKTDDPKYQQMSAVPRTNAAHSGEDVALFATGPMSHLFSSVHEQSYIAHVMAYAMCVWRYTNGPHCELPKAKIQHFSTNSGVICQSYIIFWNSFITTVVFFYLSSSR